MPMPLTLLRQLQVASPEVAWASLFQHAWKTCSAPLAQDKLAPHMSNNNYHPKHVVVENSVFGAMGRGNWLSCTEALTGTLDWRERPWDVVSNEWLAQQSPSIAIDLSGKSEKSFIGDEPAAATLKCGSASDIDGWSAGAFDLVITDPPFGGLLFYAELADFFYVWLRKVLREKYPEFFTAEYTPKTLEAISNPAQHPDDADEHYKRVLTESWREASRLLRPSGILAFTFHHSEDAPWVAVLESLFDAGFYLEATYPIRSDESKGEGEFGSKQIEYDIIHVCRKRSEEPTPVSWAKMRRQVLQDVRALTCSSGSTSGCSAAQTTSGAGNGSAPGTKRTASPRAKRFSPPRMIAARVSTPPS